MNALMKMKTRQLLTKIRKATVANLQSEVFDITDKEEHARKSLREVVYRLVRNVEGVEPDRIVLDVEYAGNGPVARNYAVVPCNLYTAFVLVMHRAPTLLSSQEEGEILAPGVGVVRYDHERGGTFTPSVNTERIRMEFGFHFGFNTENTDENV